MTLALTAAAMTRPVNPPPPAGGFLFDFFGLAICSPATNEAGSIGQTLRQRTALCSMRIPS